MNSYYSYTTNRNGKANSALLLTNSAMKVPTTFSITNALTISVWVYEVSYTFWNRIFESNSISAPWTRAQTGLAIEFIITQNTGGSPAFRYLDTSGLQTNVANSYVLPLNTWTHVIYSASGTTVSFYVNGALNSEWTGQTTPTSVSYSYSYIGYNVFNNNYYNGALDAFIILNSGITAADAVTLMNIDS